MNNMVKASLIIAGAIVLVAAICVYFSPYQTCVREYDPGLCMRMMHPGS
jgi:hypothetical protein